VQDVTQTLRFVLSFLLSEKTNFFYYDSFSACLSGFFGIEIN